MFRKNLERFFEAPAEVLEKTTEETEKIEKEIISKKPFKLAEEYWNTLGPGLTTGAADDDPSGIATYSQTGAKYGFQLLWLSLFSFPFMAIVQEMCARIGLVTGRGLAANIHQFYSRKVLYTVTILLFIGNTLNIAADLGAMAAATRLLWPTFAMSTLVIFFAALSLLLQVFSSYARYAKYLKYLALALLAYVVTALVVHLNWGEALHHTFVPSITFTKDQIFLICGILGTTISPYLFFWQTSQEVEEQILRGEKTIKQRQADVTPREVRKMRIDVWSGMFFSNAVMFFIVAATAATLHKAGITNIVSADQAAQALRPFAGDLVYWFFAIGIIGTGLLAIPVLAGSSSYAISESFGWKQGLYRKLKEAQAFYGIIIISMIIGVIANFAHLDPIKGLIYAAVANGIIAPIVIFLIVHLSRQKKIMGEYCNKPAITTAGWLITAVMAISGLAAIISIFY